MNWKAKGYIAIVILGGASSLAAVLSHWESADPARFLVFTLLAVLTSTWKISIPGTQGPLSANFLFVLVSALHLSPSETMIVACAGTLGQHLLRRRRVTGSRWVRLAFDLANAAIAVRITTSLYTAILPGFPTLDFSFRLALTGMVYFICSTMPEFIVVALKGRHRLFATWKSFFFWSFPIYMLGSAVAGVFWAISRFAGWQTSIMAVPVIYLTYRAFEMYLKRLSAEKVKAETERNHAEEVAGLHLRTIEALAMAIEAKNQSTQNHLRRMQIYCSEVGKELGLDASEMRALQAASLLHDIGKLAIPEHITSKPGRLSNEEFEKMKIHPIIGSEILERVKFPYPVVPIVRHHHERWDGSGYPDGIAGEQIPIGARILSAVDCFDALSSERLYRPAIPAAEALLFLRQESGHAFDPRVVEIIDRRHAELECMAHTSAGLDCPKSLVSSGTDAEFVNSIAAARGEAQFLYTLSQELVLAGDTAKMFRLMASRLGTVLPYDTVAYYEIDGPALTPQFVIGMEDELYAGLRIPFGQGLSGWAAESNTAIRNGNPAVELGYREEMTTVTTLRSALVVPVEGVSGVIGALALYSLQRECYSKEHLRILMAVASRLAHQVEILLRVRKAEGDATTDELTGLPNSRRLLALLRETCHGALNSKEPFALLVLDLDGFKKLNDSFGHLQGNRALQEIARRSAKLLTDGAVMARVGGDEFVVLLPGRDQPRAIAEAMEFQRLVEEAGMATVNSALLSTSWGMALFGRDGVTPEDLLAEADRRMYEYKGGKEQRMTARLTRLALSVQSASDHCPVQDALEDAQKHLTASTPWTHRHSLPQ